MNGLMPSSTNLKNSKDVVAWQQLKADGRNAGISMEDL